MSPYEGGHREELSDLNVSDVLGDIYESAVDLAGSMTEADIRNRIAALESARLDVEAQIVQLQSRATRLQNQTLIAHDALRIVSDKGLE
ncbi:MAG TPA: hypothetical protein PK096_02705 [Candidatus Saccharibacteria bacterium]|nr:hypothetical protein [Candidatus Saccharibacteria bacterium]HRK94254.1 hypothetical protein [Candidatus Saccharibacteria bacterium]